MVVSKVRVRYDACVIWNKLQMRGILSSGLKLCMTYVVEKNFQSEILSSGLKLCMTYVVEKNFQSEITWNNLVESTI